MLQIDLLRVLFQAINFLVLVLLLYRLMFRPVVRAVRERSARTQALIERAEEERQEVMALKGQLEDRQRHAEEEADEVIERARQRAEEEHSAIVDAARREAEQLVADAQNEARGARQQTVSEHSEAMLDLMLDVSGRLVGRVVPDATHAALVGQISERIYELGRESMSQVEAFRRSIAGREPDALVTTARALSAEQQGQLARTLTALADRHVNLRIEEDPRLVAGIRLRMGDLVIENSIQGELERLREAVNHMLQERLQHE
jgi:F-type H+-transporting ATPase subunit b